MQATVDLPEPLLRQLEEWAGREGATTADLIRRLVEEGLERTKPLVSVTDKVHLPLISAFETGPIQPVYGEELDELLTRENFTS